MNKDKRAQQKQQQATKRLNDSLGGSQLFTSLQQNQLLMQALFSDVDIFLTRSFHTKGPRPVEMCICYCDAVVDSAIIGDQILRPLLEQADLVPGPGVLGELRDRLLLTHNILETGDVTKIVESIAYGDTLLLVDGADHALLLSNKQFPLRAVSEPESEKVLYGPREGFVEGIIQNLAMVRRRIRTHHLKIRRIVLGTQTRTAVCVCYLDNVVNKKILAELYRRLETIDMDSVLDSQYITEQIAEASLLGFSNIGFTERPDVVVGKLLEGRIALIVDGTPMVLTLPYLFIENFQSNEDYYTNYFYATFSRLLRFVGFFFTITVPAVYIAVVSYHHEILPANLMLNIAGQRSSAPLPAVLEALVLLLVFDILRETGVRMPTHVGQTLSIVGALVIGQSAVEAKLVAAPMIIVVAFTGITNLLVPKITAASLICRYLFLVLAGSFGLLGMLVGLSLVIIHLLNMQTVGVPSLTPLSNLTFQDVKDTFIRAPWTRMTTRIAPLSPNRVRARHGEVGSKGSGPK